MNAKQEESVREALERFWDETQLGVEETEKVEGLIDELDSQSAIDAILGVEKILEIEIPGEKVIRPGGYNGKDHFVGDFLKRLRGFLATKE